MLYERQIFDDVSLLDNQIVLHYYKNCSVVAGLILETQ